MNPKTKPNKTMQPKSGAAAKRLTPPSPVAALRPQRNSAAIQPKSVTPRHKGPAAPPVYNPKSTAPVSQLKKLSNRPAPLHNQKPAAIPVQPRSPLVGKAIQRSERQRDIRANKIYSGQHGGMWYPSGSSGTSDKIWQELGITAHEHFRGPTGNKTKAEILAYWREHSYLEKSQLAARYYITVEELDKILEE